MSLRVLALSTAAPLALFIALPAAADEENSRFDEIFVSASPFGLSTEQVLSSVTVLDGAALKRRAAGTIGETLRYEPGVTSSSFGPGSSRPVIRGQSGPRVRVLDGGIGVLDASQTSPDHAVTVEPLVAERVEIVRGPAQLMYGSSAAGGVVNVFTNRIPSEMPEGGIDGAARVSATTVDDGWDAAASLTSGLLGSGFVFHIDGFIRDADDYDIPDFAQSEFLRESLSITPEPEETVANSAVETQGGAVGASYLFDNGFIGVSASLHDTEYGVPGQDEEIAIDLDQTRYDLNSEFEFDGLIEKVRFRAGYADYEHVELEEGAAGTTFTNEGFEGRLEIVKAPWRGLTGAIGLQYAERDFAAIGDEAFVPPSETTQFGVFAFESYQRGRWRYELGARYENQEIEVEDGRARDFSTVSASLGANFSPREHMTFGANLYRTERAPSAEELFSNGPHLAIGAFEVGDPDLDTESSIGAEFIFRAHTERLEGSFNMFYTAYSDYIYEAPTGATDPDEGLPVFAFLQDDASFSGFEAEGAADFGAAGPFTILGDAELSWVAATVDRVGSDRLPRIPPIRGQFGLEATSEMFDARLDFNWASERDEVADFELETTAWRTFDLFLAYKPFGEDRDVAIEVAGLNLNNETVRLHSSFLKDTVPLPGRNFRVSLRGGF